MDSSKPILILLLGIAFMASLFIIWTIIFRLREHLISTSYKFIFICKVCFALLTGSGIYLIIWPPPVKMIILQFAWFTILAIGTISSAIGFYLYSRDVKYVLQSMDYIKPLPAIPTNGIHNGEPSGKLKSGD